MRLSALPVLAIAACTPRAVTPPARTIAMTSPLEPVGGHDVQVDVARIGTIWGPNLAAGNARFRATVEPGLFIEADGGVLHVSNDGFGGNRNAYTGRLGFAHSIESWIAIGAGLGGGVSTTAGNWGSIDVGGVLSATNPYVRPGLAASVGYSAPFGDRTFTVTEIDGGSTTLQLPRNAFSQLGVSLEVGPPETALVLGASFLHFWLRDASEVPATDHSDYEDIYFTAGIGVRIATDR